MILGLNGYPRSGKDSIASYLIAHHGFTRIAFADPMRDCLYALNPMVPIDHNSQARLGNRSRARLRDIVDELGWDVAKSVHEVRELLQRMGTEAGRGVLGVNIWVDTAMRNVEQFERVALTDTRFPNEVAALKDRGGYLVRVVRPGVGAVNAHVSETAIDYILPDYQIDNDGTLDDLAAKVDFMMADLGVRV